MFLSPNDIIATGELACKLLIWTSKTRYIDPNREYRELMRDVDTVSHALDRIEHEVGNLNRRCNSTRLRLSADGKISALDLAIRGLRDTLESCEKLLRDNPKFEWDDGKSFIVKVTWELNVDGPMKALQTRIQFHCSKMNLVLEPLRMYAENCVMERLDLIHEDFDVRIERIERKLKVAGASIRELPGNVSVLPPELASKFAAAAHSKPSSGVNGLMDYVDAAVYHFEKSTRKFVDEPPFKITPEAQQYIDLLKCLWILRQMRSSRYFDRLCQDTLSKAYVRRLDRKVEYELRRFGDFPRLQAPALSDMLLRAGDSFVNNFEIWPDFGVIDTSPSMMEAQPFEKELFRAAMPALLGSRERNLIVFRSEENRLRLVTVVNSAGVPQPASVTMNCDRAVLVPLYAHPENRTSNGFTWQDGGTDYAFKTVTGAIKLQQAVTNFQVCSELVAIKAVGQGGREFGANGYIQLWMNDKPKSDVSSPQQSVASAEGSSKKSSSVRSWASKPILKKNPKSTIRISESGSFLDLPIPGQLVVFTCDRSGLRLLSITIDHDTFLDADKCDCNSSTKSATCERIVIGHRKAVQMKTIDPGSRATNGDMSRFNVALLRVPAHEKAKECVKAQSLAYVTLHLESPEKRVYFCKQFDTLRRIMKFRMASYTTDYRNMGCQQVHKDDG